MTRIALGYYQEQVQHPHGLISWSLTCDIYRLTEGPYAGWWALVVTHGATTLLDGSDVKQTKREAVEALRDALRRGWKRPDFGWVLA